MTTVCQRVFLLAQRFQLRKQSLTLFRRGDSRDSCLSLLKRRLLSCRSTDTRLPGIYKLLQFIGTLRNVATKYSLQINDQGCLSLVDDYIFTIGCNETLQVTGH